MKIGIFLKGLAAILLLLCMVSAASADDQGLEGYSPYDYTWESITAGHVTAGEYTGECANPYYEGSACIVLEKSDADYYNMPWEASERLDEVIAYADDNEIELDSELKDRGSLSRANCIGDIMKSDDFVIIYTETSLDELWDMTYGSSY